MGALVVQQASAVWAETTAPQEITLSQQLALTTFRVLDRVHSPHIYKSLLATSFPLELAAMAIIINHQASLMEWEETSGPGVEVAVGYC